MAKYVIEDTTLNNTANAIREKTGKTDKITPSNFATEIASIESGSKVTKGIIINEFDETGYATDVSIVGLTEIPDYYFGTYSSDDKNYIATNLKKVELPSGLTKIGDYSFGNCKKLTTINLLDSLIEIGNSAFVSCNLLELEEIPNGITSIGYSAFQGDIKITLSKLPDGLTYMGPYAFDKCQAITITELPSGITDIDNCCFRNCSNLTRMICNGVVTRIGNYAFQSCSNLQKIAFPNITSVPTLNSDVFKSTPIASGTGYIYVPDALVDSFKSATNWSTYGNQIKPISELEVSA